MRFAPILFAAPLLAASIAFAGGPWIISGRVVGVSDGDTITVLDADKKQHKIRFAGIDARKRAKRRGAVEAEPIGARVPKAGRSPLPQEGPLRPRGMRRVHRPARCRSRAADPVVVFDGTYEVVSTSPPIAGGPNGFDILLSFTSPFRYRPNKGNLLVDFTVFGDPPDRVFDGLGDIGDAVSRAGLRDPQARKGCCYLRCAR